MKTLEEVKTYYESATLYGEDVERLELFISKNELNNVDFEGKGDCLEFTRENILKLLKIDVENGFNYALNKREFTSALMFDMVRMWNWILEEGLENFNDYIYYGLPLFKATAVKYGFDNPIGSDLGDEFKYSSCEYYKD